MTPEERKQLWLEIALHDKLYFLARHSERSSEEAIALAGEAIAIFATKYTNNTTKDIASAKKLVKDFKRYLKEAK